uniref:Uncharacterized protein n=1 Tax=Medicago truncatula TaxID=3880 RepID=I3SH74_MEDTR|nr:unknown [Medicago truncatula]
MFLFCSFREPSISTIKEREEKSLFHPSMFHHNFQQLRIASREFPYLHLRTPHRRINGLFPSTFRKIFRPPQNPLHMPQHTLMLQPRQRNHHRQFSLFHTTTAGRRHQIRKPRLHKPQHLLPRTRNTFGSNLKSDVSIRVGSEMIS